MGSEPAQRFDPDAEALNERLGAAAPPVLEMLSTLGRAMYFPDDTVSQNEEARRFGVQLDAAGGVATERGAPMYLKAMHAFVRDLSPQQVYAYAPTDGVPSLRAAWRRRLLQENPSLAGKVFGEPIVTSALTHGLSVTADLFVGPDDVVLLPDHLWGNLRLIFGTRRGARLVSYPLFAGGKLDVAGFNEVVSRHAATGKVVVLLNFPNNPTGYMPSPAEGDALAASLARQAEKGTRIVAVCDDAYFGFFYHLGGRSMTESLFGLLVNRHPNLFAVKLDAATKELYGWGLRCGFLSLGPGRADTAAEVLAVLGIKIRGLIRGSVSTTPRISQTLVEKALESEGLAGEINEKFAILKARAEKAHAFATSERFRDAWEVYPFNSGYFMLIKVKGVEAHSLRRTLASEHHVAVISVSSTDLRISVSGLELDQIEPLFETLHRTIRKVRS
jgi:aspartate/methionine/tyrosine aminotransferase